ncbi:glutathione S-transferase [Spatholobus suberectus]|nr:glutathione S-transferase [Spatholobus suberectus]
MREHRLASGPSLLMRSVCLVYGELLWLKEKRRKSCGCCTRVTGILEKEIQGKKYFGGEKIGYLDIVAGWMSHWLNVLEELGEMELLSAERFPSLHEWKQNFIQTSPVTDCIPPRESVVEYFSFGINYTRSLAASSKS